MKTYAKLQLNLAGKNLLKIVNQDTSWMEPILIFKTQERCIEN